MLDERQLAISRLLATPRVASLESARILDVGCGTGFQLASLTELGASPSLLFGVDLLEDRIAQARKQYPNISFSCCNAEILPYSNWMFEIVTVGMLFSSILSDTMATHIADEISRVLAPRGIILWYDFRLDNPMNPHVRGMPLRRVQRLFPGFQMQMQRITLLPPLSRRLGRRTPSFYPLLARISFLQTHYIGLLWHSQSHFTEP